MSEKHLDPNESPDELNDPAAGVQRLNKLPILAVFALGFIVLATLLFSSYQRANRGPQTASAEEVKTKSNISQSDGAFLLQKYPKASRPSKPAPTEAPGQKAGKPEPAPEHTKTQKPQDYEEATPKAEALWPEPVIPSQDHRPAPVRHASLTDEEKRRAERISRFREDLYYDAVTADTAIRFQAAEKTEASEKGSPADASTASHRLLEKYMNTLKDDDAGEDRDLQKEKEKFLETDKTYGYSSEFRQAPLTPYGLRVGTVIPAVMLTGINSDLPGKIIGQVSQDVRDTRTGRYILIPQGSRIIGTYDSHVARGQTRVLVAWHRVQFPDSSTLEIGNMAGTDVSGYAGLKDKVNNHYWRIFGNATLLSFVGAGAQLSQPDSNNGDITAREMLAAELGRQWSEVGKEMARRNMNIQPTLEIRPGYRLNVMVNKDLILKPYEKM